MIYHQHTSPDNQRVAAKRRPAGQSAGSDDLSVPRCEIAADRAFLAAVAELHR